MRASVVLVLAVVLRVRGQQQPQQQVFARTELYDEQLLMQQLQIDQQQVQAQLQQTPTSTFTFVRRQTSPNAFPPPQPPRRPPPPNPAAIGQPPLSGFSQFQRPQTAFPARPPAPGIPQQSNFNPQQRPQNQNPPQQSSPNDGAPACRTTRGETGRCTPLVACAVFYADIPELRKQPCPLGPPGQFGVCCPPRDANQPIPPRDEGGVNENGVLRAPSPPNILIPQISPAQLQNAGQKGVDALRARLEFVARLFAMGIIVTPQSPASGHQEFFQTDNATLKQGENAQSGVDASISLIQDLQLTPEQGTFALPAFSLLNTIIGDTCPPEVKCDPSRKYRSADGSCNNLIDGRWGRRGVALQRILPPKYGDGVNSPRTGVALPTAREVSQRLTTGGAPDTPDDSLTLLVMQWGQFLDHDLTHTPISKGPTQSGIACCTNGKINDIDRRHPDCFPIGLPTQDPIFGPLGEQCMEFVRSLPAPRPQCNFGPREQMNQITGYIDGSNVYGSNQDQQDALRLFQGGFLRAQQTRRSTLLLPDNRNECSSGGLSCFRAGDGRVNEQPQLTVTHTVWLREHNRLAAALGEMHPKWSDEAIFQEARRIVVAQMQHITYNEWLPIILGRERMDLLRLSPQENGGTRLYDETLNAGITNVFATAAFRFGHSLIRDSIQTFSQFGTIKEDLPLHRNQFSPFVLYKEGAFDDLLRGLLTQTCQRFDRFFSREVTDKLFQGSLPFGLDLVALNIQRGRDHGLPPYNEWRSVCGSKSATSWRDLAVEMEPSAVSALQAAYADVNEVDLFPALVAERPLRGALVGPTLACILGDQFVRLRRGDRYFYEEQGQNGSFTPEQLAEIKKTSLSRILCDNSDDMVRLQPLAFFKSNFANQRVDCTSDAIPRLNLAAWANEPVPV
ncbi:peroxidase-like isoform X2 [Neocloeon triangulifer]|uniref:peroxidase-like isoform X2 n=1 Tax=Neocloeon triangulifer TaxID=2078957 RepID=UPI00286ECBE2|nr:peroxidase-like isoform X2 [Neocloeon triangulifer]